MTHGCELPYGCQELSKGPLQDKHVLLTTEALLQPYLRGVLCRHKYLIHLGKYQKLKLFRVFSPRYGDAGL